jgi:hypothetical protein
MDNTTNNTTDVQGSAERMVTTLLANPAICKLIEQAGTQLAANTDRQRGFWDFLRSIDIAQKVYNLLLIVVVFVGVVIMKKHEAINNEAAQTILAMVIGAGLGNAIRNFFGSRKR